jgi:hypothetical protein
MIGLMTTPSEIPNDLKTCQALVRAQSQKIEELSAEMEKLRKLLSHMVHGHRSEKRVLPALNQAWLPFDTSEEFQAARAEVEAQAEAIVQTYTVTRAVPKDKRDESLPGHLRRIERVIEGDATEKICVTHGESATSRRGCMPCRSGR